MRNPFAAGAGLHRCTRAGLAHDREAARAEVLRLEDVIRGLDTTVIEQGDEITRLKAAAVDVGVERQLRAAAERKAAHLKVQMLALKARVDNEHAITVPPMHRDIDADEQPTEPHGIAVLTLPESLNPGAA